MPCPYSNLFGPPRTGVHTQRIFGFGVVDIVVTVITAIPFAYLFRIPFWKALLGWFVFGEVLHYVLGVQTAFLDLLNLHVKC